MTTTIRIIISALLLAILTTTAFAQVSGKAFDGFTGNSKDPVQIEADELEVLDQQSKAIFKGNVKVRQGSSLIRTKRLVVNYVKGSQGGQGDIEKLSMSGGLIVTSKDNTVTADQGTYLVKSEQVLLTGNVVVSQGSNVAKGNKLTANLKNNQAVLSGGRVKSIFTPGTKNN